MKNLSCLKRWPHPQTNHGLITKVLLCGSFTSLSVAQGLNQDITIREIGSVS
jgi:hypothetical protein